MAPTKKEEMKRDDKKCQECWGIHPQHRAYCSWSTGSNLAKQNIVSPTYKNTKDQKVMVNGGYEGIARHVEDLWGTSKNGKEETTSKKTEAKAAKVESEEDWEKVEGEWVEI